jgi:hypothetical protein
LNGYCGETSGSMQRMRFGSTFMPGLLAWDRMRTR